MTYVQRCLVVTAANQALAQMLCETLAGEAGAGMFVTGLSSSGNLPATHYISEGMISDDMAMLLDNPAMLFAACQQAGLPQTLAECEALLNASDISQDTAFGAMARLGLKLIVS